MKKALLLLFTSSILWAQNIPELFNTNWYISQMVIGGQTTITPVIDFTVQPSTFAVVSGNNVFTSKYFNVSAIGITFSTIDDTFMKSSSGSCTIADYSGTNMTAVQGYDQKNCDFYGLPSIGNAFSYEIVPNGSGKTLVVTNISNGNKIYYNSFILGTKENETKSAFSVFPNPVKESLTIDNLGNGLSVKVFNMLGQLMYEGKTTDRKIKIDAQKFSTGEYILTIQNHKSYKFIKE